MENNIPWHFNAVAALRSRFERKDASRKLRSCMASCCGTRSKCLVSIIPTPFVPATTWRAFFKRPESGRKQNNSSAGRWEEVEKFLESSLSAVMLRCCVSFFCRVLVLWVCTCKAVGEEVYYIYIMIINDIDILIYISIYNIHREFRDVSCISIYFTLFWVRQEASGHSVSHSQPGALFEGQRPVADSLDLHKELLESCRQAFGQLDPHTLACVSSLGRVMEELGRLDEAEHLQRDVVEVSKASLGSNHPETLRFSNNLACLLHGRGRLIEARQLHAEVLKFRKEGLGNKHLDSLVSANNLACLLQEQQLGIFFYEECVCFPPMCWPFLQKGNLVTI